MKRFQLQNPIYLQSFQYGRYPSNLRQMVDHQKLWTLPCDNYLNPTQILSWLLPSWFLRSHYFLCFLSQPQKLPIAAMPSSAALHRVQQPPPSCLGYQHLSLLVPRSGNTSHFSSALPATSFLVFPSSSLSRSLQASSLSTNSPPLTRITPPQQPPYFPTSAEPLLLSLRSSTLGESKSTPFLGRVSTSGSSLLVASAT